MEIQNKENEVENTRVRLAKEKEDFENDYRER